MSPEELDELRKSAEMVQCIGIQNAAVCRHPYNGVNNASFALVNLPDLLAHIDSQAAQIKQLEDHNDLLQNELFELRKGKDAQEAISDLMAQIEALKEMLVSMTTTAIWKASYDSLTGKYTISDADAEKMARQQLKAYIQLREAREQIKRLEAAFLKLYVNQLVGCNMPREVAEKQACDALKRIKEEREG